MQPGVLWTHLSKAGIVRRLAAAGVRAGHHIVGQLMARHHIGRRQCDKSQHMGENPGRNAQFEAVASHVKTYMDSPNPVVSIDTKKRELLGNFKRPGTLYTQRPPRVFDHDFPSFADGIAIPHGLYDLKRNRGHITLGTSHDTGEFACASIETWWRSEGLAAYPDAASLLLLCDCGGSNNAAHHIFKQDLHDLAGRIGLEIRVAHYPPYASKYNPIDHRLFPHVTRACKGLVLTTLEQVREHMAAASTATGLTVTAGILDRVFETGRKVAAGFNEAMHILRDEVLPKWNYRVLPSPA